MALHPSRHQRRITYLTKDPNGPREKRLDVLLPREDYEMFQEIMDMDSTRRRETLQTMIHARYLEIKAQRAAAARGTGESGRARRGGTNG